MRAANMDSSVITALVACAIVTDGASALLPISVRVAVLLASSPQMRLNCTTVQVSIVSVSVLYE